MRDLENGLKRAKSSYWNSVIALVLFTGVGAFMWWGFVEIWFFYGLGTVGVLYSSLLAYYTFVGNKRIMEIKDLAVKNPEETKNAVINWALEIKKNYDYEVERAKSIKAGGRGRRQARTNAKFLKKRHNALLEVAKYIEDNMI